MPRAQKNTKGGKGGAGGKKKKGGDDDEFEFKSKTLQKLAKESNGGKKGGKKKVIQASSAAAAQTKLKNAKAKHAQKKAQKKEYANFDDLSDDEDEEEVAKRMARDAARADRMGINKEDLSANKSAKKVKKEQAKLDRQLNQTFEHFEVEAVINYEGSDKADAKAEEGEAGEQDCLRIRPFSLSFHGNQLFKDAAVTFTVGERYGLVGPNGSGKSTVLRHIASRQLPGVMANLDLLHVEQEADGSEETAIDSVLAADEVRLNLLKEKDELEVLQEGLSDEEEAARAEQLAKVYAELAAIGADQAPARAAKILSGLQFTPAMQQQATQEFSGGWRMRIALARALFRQPSLLLLDEPTNHLDLHAVIWLEEYLRRTWKKTLVIVSHDRSFLNNVCTRIVHLDQQKLVMYKGDFETFTQTLETKRRAQENLYKKQQQQLANTKKKLHGDSKAGGKGRKGASASMTTQAKKDKEKKLKQLEADLVDKVETYSVEFNFPDPVRQLDHPVIQVDDVSFSYPGATPEAERKPIFTHANFGLDMEARVALVGPNGCGKSTLLGLLFGKLQPDTGMVTINRHLKIGHFAQHFADQLELNMSAFQYLARNYPDAKSTGRGDPYRKALGMFGLPRDAHNQPIATLSGGQKNRVIFASISLMEPDILYLDEPTNHLDMESIEALSDALDRYEGGVIVVSHDARLIDTVCDQVWVVGDGKVEPLIVNNDFGDIYDYRQSLIDKLTDDDF